jgi:4'-phosphopantetheinyl transferase
LSSSVGKLVVGPWSAVGQASSLADRLEACPTNRGYIHLITIPLETPPIPEAELSSYLTADERERAERYRVEKARGQFVVTRGLLRLTLGGLLGIAPGKVPITYTGVGKPVLQGIPDALQFNVTHTDGLALIALAHSAIGVDIERLRTLANPEGLVERFFSRAERDCYRSLEPAKKMAGFFRAWTCKEALLKAAGSSVAYLDLFDVELNPDRPAMLLASRHPGLIGNEWALVSLEPELGYAAAVAVAGRSDGETGQTPRN